MPFPFDATLKEIVQKHAADFAPVLGLPTQRLDRSTLAHIFQGVGAMKESSGYQIILEEGEIVGRTKEIQKVLVRLGRKRFGPPNEATEAALEAITDLERLERMADAVLTAANWQELLATS